MTDREIEQTVQQAIPRAQWQDTVSAAFKSWQFSCGFCHEQGPVESYGMAATRFTIHSCYGIGGPRGRSGLATFREVQPCQS